MILISAFARNKCTHLDRFKHLILPVAAFFILLIQGCNDSGGSRGSKPEQLLTDTVSTWTAGIVYDSVRIPSDGFSIIREVRAARHREFDRIVFQFGDAGIPGFHLEYVDKPVYECGSGKPVFLPGDGWLMIKFLAARMHEEGASTVEQRDQEMDLPVLIRLTSICDFENYVTWIASVRTPNRYQVIALDDPPRLVVDIRYHGGN